MTKLFNISQYLQGFSQINQFLTPKQICFYFLSRNIFESWLVKYISMSNMSKEQTSSSFISNQQQNILVRILKKVDIFAFIPVPKDDTVSTRPSLIGTGIFFVLFLTYVIYDFYKFLTNNPPLIQSYRTPLDENYYTLPNFAMAFMENNPYYNKTQSYDDFLTYDGWNTKAKTIGIEYNVPIDITLVTNLNGKEDNFEKLPWMSLETKRFYQSLRTPTLPLKSRGLLFKSNVSVYPSIKFSFCQNSTSKINCKTQDEINALTDFGRIFFFIQQTKDESSVSKDTAGSNGNNYLQYNFFLLQGYYKRVTISFRVVRTQVLPDYFRRWTPQTTVRLQIDKIQQQVSKVNSLVPNPDAIAFNLQLSADILNNRVAFTTFIDHVSLWGAFWGVLFAVFAIFFLSYNRKKFYKKNPQWDRFKKVAGGSQHKE